MIRCRTCVMPSTRPDVPFDASGQCQACINYANRPAIDWEARKRDLEHLLERGRNTSGFDCIVPSSGGKDSHAQVLKLIELGAKPLVVTASTCHLTKIGRMNIDNLARYATTLELTPNRTTRAALNRMGLEMVGDISWPEHVGIFTTPFRVAAAFGIPLIFYGENPQDQYGGPQGSEAAAQMTKRWRSEFGGFLGLRPSDFKAMSYDMADYEMPADDDLERVKVEAHFMGSYFPWDSHANARAAKAAGMVQVLPCSANWWNHENADNAQTGLHDFFGWLKYGYGRACAQVSVDVRMGLITREQALGIVQQRDGLFPEVYMGVAIEEVLQRIGITRAHLNVIMANFTNKALHERAA